MDTFSYKIYPKGRVKGGEASYSLDTTTGLIKYSAKISAKISFFPVNKEISGEYQMEDPSMLISKGIKPRQEIRIGSLVFKVGDSSAKQAPVSITSADNSLNGSGIVSLAKKFISVVSLVGIAKVYGFSFDLDIRP